MLLERAPSKDHPKFLALALLHDVSERLTFGESGGNLVGSHGSDDLLHHI